MREQTQRFLYPLGLLLILVNTNYTLCVDWEGMVEHYHIMYHASKLCIHKEVYFENLRQLVEDANGLHAPHQTKSHGRHRDHAV